MQFAGGRKPTAAAQKKAKGAAERNTKTKAKAQQGENIVKSAEKARKIVHKVRLLLCVFGFFGSQRMWAQSVIAETETQKE